MDDLGRRDFLSGAGALLAIPAVAGCAGGAAAPERAGPVDGAALERTLAGVAEDLLAEYPENATALGLDKEARSALKSRLTDRSLLGRGRHAALTSARLKRIRDIDPGGLSQSQIIDRGVAETAHALAAEGFRFPYGDVVSLNQ